MPGAHIDKAGFELEIGFGDFKHLGGVPVRLLHYFRDLSGLCWVAAHPGPIQLVPSTTLALAFALNW